MNELISAMSSAVQKETNGNLKEIENFFTQKFDGNIPELVQALKEGDITMSDFKMELEREKLILEAELLTQEIASESDVQKAVDAAMDVLVKEVR